MQKLNSVQASYKYVLFGGCSKELDWKPVTKENPKDSTELKESVEKTTKASSCSDCNLFSSSISLKCYAGLTSTVSRR